MKIDVIIEAIKNKKFRITDHAYDEAEADKLKFDEIYFSVMNGEIIESYPNDKPYPSCLIFGKTSGNEPVHSVWAYNEENSWAVLITVYRPDPELWINFKERRKQT
ncbi:MAG: DUF4258 domain-containing protein [Bacteroidetes bacterium]|nr:DUF4258 domain-containing protein [Bacteroidota bacterium]MBU2584427.1 DUF4258 domain-containing protein [Bacteroidota bacterium]